MGGGLIRGEDDAFAHRGHPVLCRTSEKSGQSARGPVRSHGAALQGGRAVLMVCLLEQAAESTPFIPCDGTQTAQTARSAQ